MRTSSKLRTASRSCACHSPIRRGGDRRLLRLAGSRAAGQNAADLADRDATFSPCEDAADSLNVGHGVQAVPAVRARRPDQAVTALPRTQGDRLTPVRRETSRMGNSSRCSKAFEARVEAPEGSVMGRLADGNAEIVTQRFAAYPYKRCTNARCDEMTPDLPLTLYVDRSCPLCAREVRWLERQADPTRLRLVDISAAGFDPAGLGVDLPQLRRRLHARSASGIWLTGVDATYWSWRLAGHGRWAAPLGWRPLRPMLRLAYQGLQPAAPASGLAASLQTAHSVVRKDVLLRRPSPERG